MYNIIFYKDKNGVSDILDLITELNNKAVTSKDERIQLKQIRFHINILEKLGTRAGEQFVKHIQNRIWELRPGYNRILFFAWFENNIVLLHFFRKSANKTPKSELEKAIKKMEDWEERYRYNE
ncbi:MAG TPA: type II toxin-antitoxin system RelE/ParE family toxin [Clostridiales bacterium]|jgi:phage-related protein|nr:type II toxin-antitoxin system RelE/ParE family toxin [Clostridiales bacterium]